MGIKFPNFLEKNIFSHGTISKFCSTGHVYMSKSVPTGIFFGRVSGLSTLPIVSTKILETFV